MPEFRRNGWDCKYPDCLPPDPEGLGAARACFGKAKRPGQLLQVPTDGRVARKDGKVDVVYEAFDRCPTATIPVDVPEVIRRCREWLLGVRADGFEPSALFADAIMLVERLDGGARRNNSN